MSGNPGRFAPDGVGPTGLFVDSSAFYAYFYPDDERHDDARTFFARVRDGDLPYRPLFTDDYVLDEVVTRLRMHAGYEAASEALAAIHDGSTVRCERVSAADLTAAIDRFRTYPDHELSFTDHVIVAQMERLDLDHVLTYDGDFAAFDYTTISRTR